MKTTKIELPAFMGIVLPAAMIIFIYALSSGADEVRNDRINVSGNSKIATNLEIESRNSNQTSSVSTNASEEVIAIIPPNFSALALRPEIEEIVKMAQSGVSEDIIIQYINQSTNSYTNLTASEIITLNDLGIPAAVISAMLKKAGKSEQEIQKITEEKRVVSATNETMVATLENAVTNQPALLTASGQPTNQIQFAQNQPQVYTQTVYVPVQAEQPQVIVQQQPVLYQQPLPQTVVVYYEYLSPYGSWLYVDGYGYCWQPTISVINPWWRPYYHGGRWIWTDFGWYWLSDYSWGWIPFHYGRWHYHHRRGWLWVPDTVWGPAWVSWRITPTYCGWAPLPPRAHYHAGVGFVYHGRNVDIHFDFGLSDWHYTFVSWHYFHHRDFYRGALPRDRVKPVYENSTVINNYIVGNNNNVVINVGVGTEHISRTTREEVKKVAVRDIPPQGAKPIYSERLLKEGNNIVLYRPSPQVPVQSKVDGQFIKPPAMVPVKNTIAEKTFTTPATTGIPSVSPMKISTPAMSNPRTIYETQKPKEGPVISTILKNEDSRKRILPVERPLGPAQRQAIEPSRPGGDTGREPKMSILSSRPVQPMVSDSSGTIVEEKTTPSPKMSEIAKAEVPKNVIPSLAPSSIQKDAAIKGLSSPKSAGVKPIPILPNHGLTAETYSSPRTGPVAIHPPFNTDLTQTRSRSPSGSASKIESPIVTPIDRETRIRQEVLQSRPSAGGEARTQSLPVSPYKSLPRYSSEPSVVSQIPRSELRVPSPLSPPPPGQPQGGIRPITPVKPAESQSRTTIQPGGVRFTPLPTPNTPPTPIQSQSPASIVPTTPRSISPPASSSQTPIRNISPSPAPRSEAPKPVITPSPAPQSQPRTYNVPPQGTPQIIPSSPPAMPSGPRSRLNETR